MRGGGRRGREGGSCSTPLAAKKRPWQPRAYDPLPRPAAAAAACHVAKQWEEAEERAPTPAAANGPRRWTGRRPVRWSPEAKAERAARRAAEWEAERGATPTAPLQLASLGFHGLSAVAKRIGS